MSCLCLCIKAISLQTYECICMYFYIGTCLAYMRSYHIQKHIWTCTDDRCVAICLLTYLSLFLSFYMHLSHFGLSILYLSNLNLPSLFLKSACLSVSLLLGPGPGARSGAVGALPGGGLARTACAAPEPQSEPRGSKYPIFKGSGSKDHTLNGCGTRVLKC